MPRIVAPFLAIFFLSSYSMSIAILTCNISLKQCSNKNVVVKKKKTFFSACVMLAKNKAIADEVLHLMMTFLFLSLE